MRKISQYIRSALFIFAMYAWMLILGIIGAIPAALSREWAYAVMHMYCANVLWLLRVLCGITYEVRGEIPTGDVVVASKHQSFLDVILHSHIVPRMNFVMKRELKYAPVLGFYAMRIGAAPVKRGDKSRAVSQMMKGVERDEDDVAQLIIYPQGTRVAPGDYLPYKVGAAVICSRLGKPCYPAATNAGIFWPKRGILRNPGVVVVEYLDAMPEGLKLEAFTKVMEERIETASDKLMAEAGFVPKT